VMIHLDARRPGAMVPPNLRGEAHLRLNLSYRFDPPDLTVGDWGVRSTLSFSGSRFTVAVPWSALFAITSHATKEFWMYPDDMPEELIQQTVAPPSDPARQQEARAAPRAMLREVATPAPAASDSEPVQTPEPAPEPAAEPAAEPPQDEPPRPK